MVEYKDDATAFNGLKKGTIRGKGVVNNKMSNFMFKLLAEKGIETHFVKEISDRETIVKKVSIVPLEVIIRNKAAGSLAKKLGLEEGMELKCPILEFSYKNDERGDPTEISPEAMNRVIIGKCLIFLNFISFISFMYKTIPALSLIHI